MVIRFCFGFRVSCFGFALLLSAAGCPSKTPRDANEQSGKSQVSSGKTSNFKLQTSNSPAYYRYKVVKEYPHDPCAFTQGLIYENGFLYEGTGLYHRQSKLIKRDFKTWEIVKQIRLPDQYFGEGITIVGNRIIQLTWQEHTGFVYDKNTLQELSRFSHATEGWGLTYDGKRLILSDGSNTLYFLDPNTFVPVGANNDSPVLRVTDRGRPIRYINELEYIPGGEGILPLHPDGTAETAVRREGETPSPPSVILANILGANTIAIISAQTGNVTGWINLNGMYTPPPGDDDNHVLNGIAYLPETKHLLVTGKCWTKMFEIEIK